MQSRRCSVALLRVNAAPAVRWHGRAGLQQIAQLRWLPRYDDLLEYEPSTNAAGEQGSGEGQAMAAEAT
eukprot:4977002-Prymnesium_polylepis.1